MSSNGKSLTPTSSAAQGATCGWCGERADTPKGCIYVRAWGERTVSERARPGAGRYGWIVRAVCPDCWPRVKANVQLTSSGPPEPAA